MTDKITWTQKELQEFDRLVDMVSSRNNLHRIEGRIDMNKFVQLHGKEKCDAMFEELEGDGEA